MSAVQACMGGWCRRRELCGHYHAASAAQEPSERLCPRGNDGAAMKESADMTRILFSTAARVEQVAAALTPAGVTTLQIAQALGIKTDSRMSLIMKAAVAAGAAFGTFARVSQDKQTPEMVYFPTEADRDTFRAAYEVWREQRAKERRSGTDRARYQRNRDKEVAKRSAAREAARELREANRLAAELVIQAERAQRKAQREARSAEKAAAQAEQRRQEAALRRAEAEQRKERARLDREAAAAQKQRAKAEAKKTKERLKAETKAAGALVFKGGTDSPKAAKPRGPAMLPGEPIIPAGVEVKRMPGAPASRWGVESAPCVINSRECRSWAREAVAA